MKIGIGIKFIISLAVTFTAPVIGSLFTRQAVSDWLGFARVQNNVLYAANSRGKI